MYAYALYHNHFYVVRPCWQGKHLQMLVLTRIMIKEMHDQVKVKARTLKTEEGKIK